MKEKKLKEKKLNFVAWVAVTLTMFAQPMGAIDIAGVRLFAENIN